MNTVDDFKKFVNENPVAALATVEKGEPRVRHFMRAKWDDKGLLFVTAKNKEVYAQLSANNAIALSFWSANTNAMVRIVGRAEFTEEKAVKEEVLSIFTFLKPIAEKEGDGFLAPFFVRQAKASLWTMEKGTEPVVWVELGI